MYTFLKHIFHILSYDMYLVRAYAYLIFPQIAILGIYGNLNEHTHGYSSPIAFKQRLYSSSLAISPILFKSQMLSNCAWKSSNLIISLFIIIPTYRTFITPYCFNVIKPYPICSCPYFHFITASITYYLLHLSHPLFNIRPHHLSNYQQGGDYRG